MIVNLSVVVDIIAVAISNTVDDGNGYLEKGKKYIVHEIMIGQSSTYVYLKDGLKIIHANSVDLEFYYNGREIDIYSSAFFNPYMKPKIDIEANIKYVEEIKEIPF